jgi:hypothetical protein
LSPKELANSDAPISDHLVRGVKLRHHRQRGGWPGGEVVLAVTDETVTLAPYRTNASVMEGMQIDYGLAVVVQRRGLIYYDRIVSDTNEEVP